MNNIQNKLNIIQFWKPTMNPTQATQHDFISTPPVSPNFAPEAFLPSTSADGFHQHHYYLSISTNNNNTSSSSNDRH